MVTKFKPTVPMATYLFAMVVSDFDCVSAPEGLYRLPVRVRFIATIMLLIIPIRKFQQVVLCHFRPAGHHQLSVALEVITLHELLLKC